MLLIINGMFYTKLIYRYPAYVCLKHMMEFYEKYNLLV